MSSALDEDRTTGDRDPGSGAGPSEVTVLPWVARPFLTQARWVRIVGAWCVGVGALTMPLLGRASAVALIATLALWAALLTALATWSSRQRLLWQRLTVTSVVPAATWVVAYAVVAAVGLRWWPDLGWAWLVADLGTLAAPVIAALLSARWQDRHAGSR